MTRLSPLVVSVLSLGACAPSLQEFHLEQIDREVILAERESAEPDVALARVEEAPVLDRARLVRAVLSRNPTLAAARARWRAAAARYHEADALPDPVLSYTLAPGSIFDSTVRYGQVIKLSQSIPWIGKMGSRGDVELHRAEMRATDHAEARLELALETCRLFDRLYVVDRRLAINEATAALVDQLARSIEAHYAAGNGTLYEPLQAEAVRAHIEHEETVLASHRRVLIAQLNTLLNRPPEAPLAAPPERLPLLPMPRAEAIDDETLARRPDYRRKLADERRIEAELDLAQREYVPDFTVFGSYNSMWATLSHQLMVGISAPLPFVVDRRAGAESAARAELAANGHERAALDAEIRGEHFAALEQLREAHHVAMLYEERLLPLAERQAAAVRPAFAAGDATFYEVIAAERNLWTLRADEHEALANLHTRMAELERARGEVPGVGGDR